MRSAERTGLVGIAAAILGAVDNYIVHHSQKLPLIRAKGKDYAYGGAAASGRAFEFRRVKGRASASQRSRSNRRKAQR